MLLRLVVAATILAGAYAAFGIWQARSALDFLTEPKAGFTTVNDGGGALVTIVEFLNYACGPCLDTHEMLLAYARRTPDVRLVVRPVPFEPQEAEVAAEMALAAGLQGKFWELDSALAGYRGDYNEKFYREAAALHEIDFEKMAADANGSAVFELARNNASAAIRAGVERTPALLVGKTLYHVDGVLTLPDLLRMVQAQRPQ